MRRRSGVTAAPRPAGAARLLLLLVVAITLLTAGALFASFEHAWADSGGWPTATATIVALPTLAPTWPPLAPTIVVLPTVPLATPVDNFLVVATPTPPPPTGIRGLSFCWPFALAFIVVVMIAGIVFMRRRSV